MKHGNSPASSRLLHVSMASAPAIFGAGTFHDFDNRYSDVEGLLSDSKGQLNLRLEGLLSDEGQLNLRQFFFCNRVAGRCYRVWREACSSCCFQRST